MNEQPDTKNGEYDETKRKFKNDGAIAEKALLGDAPAIQKQKRRQEQQEEYFGIENHVKIRHGRYQRAQPDLHQRQG